MSTVELLCLGAVGWLAGVITQSLERRRVRSTRQEPVAYVVARETDERVEEYACGDGWSSVERPNLYSLRLANLRADGAKGAYVLPLQVGKRGPR